MTASLPVLIAADQQLQSFSVHSLFRALEADKGLTRLSCIAAWCVGEYGELLASACPRTEDSPALEAVAIDRVVAVLGGIMESSLTLTLVKQYVLTALVWLFARCPPAHIIFVYVYVYMYVCIVLYYIYIYVYICILYIYIHTHM